MSIKDVPGKEQGDYSDLCVDTINNVVVAVISSFRDSLNEQNKQRINGDKTIFGNKLKELSQQITELSRSYLKGIPQSSDKGKVQKSPTTNSDKDQAKKISDKRRLSNKSDSINQSKKNCSKMNSSRNKELTITSTTPTPDSKIKKCTDPRKELKAASLTLSEGPILTIVKRDGCIIPPTIKECPQGPNGSIITPSMSIVSQTVDYCKTEQTQTIDRKADLSIKSIQAQVETIDTAQETETSNTSGSNSTQTDQSNVTTTDTETEDDCANQRNDAAPSKSPSIVINELQEVEIQTDEDEGSDDYFACDGKENVFECTCKDLEGVDSCGCMSGYNKEYFSIASRLDETEKRLQDMWTKMFAITRTLKEHVVHCADVDNTNDIKKHGSC